MSKLPSKNRWRRRWSTNPSSRSNTVDTTIIPSSSTIRSSKAHWSRSRLRASRRWTSRHEKKGNRCSNNSSSSSNSHQSSTSAIIGNSYCKRTKCWRLINHQKKLITQRLKSPKTNKNIRRLSSQEYNLEHSDYSNGFNLVWLRQNWRSMIIWTILRIWRSTNTSNFCLC